MVNLLGSADIILASSAERSIHRAMPDRPSSAQGACAPKNCSGRRAACEDLGIAAGTAASTPKIKHRTSVRVHWFISDCKTKREADWQVIMDEQAL